MPLKALNNLMSAAHLLVTRAEAMLAGQEFGLDPAAMLGHLQQSPAGGAARPEKQVARLHPDRRRSTRASGSG